MAQSERSTAQKVGVALLWVVSIAVALAMLAAGAMKFQPDGMWPALFEGWGYSMAFLYLIGVLEVGGALALLVPRFASYAASMLVVVMLGAAYTLIANPGDMGPSSPLVFGAALAIIAFARREARWKPGG